jgi:tetratricopeptide (TPR) repeat protein
MADLGLLASLENVRMRSMPVETGGTYDLKWADGMYGQAFGLVGGVPRPSVEEAAERIRGTTVAVELAAALDHWALIRQKLRGADDPSWKALLQVARLADPDPTRARVREALERRDRQALLTLASSGDVSGLSLEMLTFLLEDNLDSGQKEKILRAEQRRHPDNFEANRSLFEFFYNLEPREVEEAYHFAAVIVALRPDDIGARLNLGIALSEMGRLDDAIAEYQEVLRIKKDEFRAHINIGTAMAKKGLLDEAIAEYREAIRIKKDDAVPHYGLGNGLRDKGQLDEAIAEYREAIRIKKDYPEAHCNLGLTLERQGLFRQTVEELRRGHELGSNYPRWRYPSSQWVRNCERLVELDGKLPAILSGQKQPVDTAERLALAQLCQKLCKQQYLAAQRFYSQAFAAEPQLTGDQPSSHRYNAACAAALAGCGQGNGADKLDAKERVRLRKQALDWLRDDLKAWCRVLDKSADKAGSDIAPKMRHWLQDTDFADVRGPEALARLPETERQEWQKLWEEVEAMRQRAAKRPAAASSRRP